jgi:hypothetical protein
MNTATRKPIIIPCALDQAAILSVLGQLNLLKTGAKVFGNMEIRAACKWARIPGQEVERFLDAVAGHGLFKAPEPVPPRAPWRMPVAKRRK